MGIKDRAAEMAERAKRIVADKIKTAATSYFSEPLAYDDFKGIVSRYSEIREAEGKDLILPERNYTIYDLNGDQVITKQELVDTDANHALANTVKAREAMPEVFDKTKNNDGNTVYTFNYTKAKEMILAGGEATIYLASKAAKENLLSNDFKLDIASLKKVDEKLNEFVRVYKESSGDDTKLKPIYNEIITNFRQVLKGAGTSAATNQPDAPAVAEANIPEDNAQAIGTDEVAEKLAEIKAVREEALANLAESNEGLLDGKKNDADQMKIAIDAAQQLNLDISSIGAIKIVDGKTFATTEASTKFMSASKKLADTLRDNNANEETKKLAGQELVASLKAVNESAANQDIGTKPINVKDMIASIKAESAASPG